MATQKIQDYHVLAEERDQAGEKMSYQDELHTTEWKKRREEIITRDNSTCAICNFKPSDFANPDNFKAMTDDEQKEYVKEYQAGFSQSVAEFFIELNGYLPQPGNHRSIPKYDNLPTKPIILNVHHKLYVRTRLAWEYMDDELITYCQNCHQSVHDQTNIPYYKDETQVVAFY
jgi:5-methylcytosine-specific restriction endonuclease McrA